MCVVRVTCAPTALSLEIAFLLAEANIVRGYDIKSLNGVGR